MEIKKRLETSHRTFLKSIGKNIIGEFLVGSSVYSEEKNLSDKSDIDAVCIVDKDNLTTLLNSRYLSGLIDPEIAKAVLDKHLSDYLFIKVIINGVLLSLDIITPEFFEHMCNINLIKSRSKYISKKFGNEPQRGKYLIEEFNGKRHFIKKRCISKNEKKYIIELPLFFIKRGKYARGIPTAKFLTNKIFYDPLGIIKTNIDLLYGNVIKRLLYEYPNITREETNEYFLNLLIGRNKFPKEYKEKILNQVNAILMKMEDDKIGEIKEEVYKLFQENAKGDYLDPRWIFPNHFEVMNDLIKDMCEKYKISEKISEEVIECISSTDKDKLSKPKSINAQILRTADVLSQFISVHYFAKASFFNNWDFFIKWMKERVDSCYNKICFDEERKIAKPIRDYMINAIKIYDQHKKDYPPLNEEKEENEFSKDN